MAKRKILLVTPSLPYPLDRGCKTRIFHVLKHLSKKHYITVVCMVSDRKDLQYKDKVAKYCERLEVVLSPNRKSIVHRVVFKMIYMFLSTFTQVSMAYFYANLPAFVEKIRSVIREEKFDIIQLEYWYVGASFLNESIDAFKVIDTHGLIFMKNESILSQKRCGILRSWFMFKLRQRKKHELETIGKFDLIITVTDYDKKVFFQFLGNSKRIEVIPTGVDTRFYTLRNSIQKNSIVFYGAMDMYANVDAVLYFYHQVFPILRREIEELQFLVLGSNPPKEVLELTKDSSVTITGYVEDVRPYLWCGRIMVVPFRHCYGIRGRIFEAMACGIPVIATPAAVRGMQLKHKRDLIIANLPNEFADWVIKLIGDYRLRKFIIDNARRLVEEEYANEVVYGRLSSIYTNLDCR